MLCISDISIIIRAKDRFPIQSIESLQESRLVETEIIVVGKWYDSNQSVNMNCIVIKTDALMFQARFLGLEAVTSKKVLFLDSDQVVQPGLLDELVSIHTDMCMIPERSINRNFTGKIMDMKRRYVENSFRFKPSPFVAVAPRFYSTDLLLKAFENIPESELKTITQHEDSILFHESWRINSEISFSSKMIFDVDPGISVFMRKAFYYGKANRVALKSGTLSREHLHLINSLDRDRKIVEDGVGFNWGLLADVIKAGPYVLGQLAGSFGE